MPRRLHRPHRRLLIAMLWVVTHPRTVLGISLIALIACLLLAFFKLGISTNQDELFSSKVAFFKNYINFTRDFPENQATYVMVEAADPVNPPPTAEWIAIADAITDQLKRDTDDVKGVDSHVPLQQLGNQGILFEDSPQVRQDFNDFQLLSVPFRPTNLLNRSLGVVPIQRFLNAMQPRRFGGRAPTTQSCQFINLMAGGMTAALKHPSAAIRLGDQVPDLAQLGATDPSRLGYYYVPDEENHANHLLLILVFERNDFSRTGGLENAIAGIRKTVATAAAPFKHFHAALTGRPALEADEMSTTDRDARYAEIAALSAVFIGLVVLLRSVWTAVVAEVALLVGIGWTFGWATVTVHRLNLLSMVFLIALTGIGMDYLIQVLTRFGRESARRTSPRGIWIGVFKYVAAPINTACLGAAGAFLVSVFTNFRGAAELGIVASGGLLLCLLAGYVILPPLLTLFPPKPRHADAERSSNRQHRLQETTFPAPPTQIPAQLGLANSIEVGIATIAIAKRSRTANLWLAPPIVWAALLLVGIPFARRAEFNPSLLKMQAQSLESVQLIHKLQTWSAVVLAPPSQLIKLRQVRDAVLKSGTVSSTESILTAYDNQAWLAQQQAADILGSDYDPVTAENIPAIRASAQKLAEEINASNTPSAVSTACINALVDFAKTIDQTSTALAADRLSAWQQAFIQHLKDQLAQFRPPALDLNAIPGSLRAHLIGEDGQFALYIYPKFDLWKQSNLAAFVSQVEGTIDKIPDAPSATGIAINVYHSTSSIEKSFYHSAGYALALIFVLVLVDLKNLGQTLLAISVLAMGLPMLVALMGLLHIDWNFANFFGLPILIGAGHEYGVFMVHRHNEAASDCHRRWRGWDVSDKALLLCAYVTSVSFGFFWLLGHHQGLKSLGLVMALGTACIYLATLCVLRPLLLWKLGNRKAASPV